MATRSSTMLMRCSLLLLCLTCVQPTEDISYNVSKDRVSEYNRFSLWPSMHNAASRFLRYRRDTPGQKDSVQPSAVIGTEGGDAIPKPQSLASPTPAAAISAESNKTKTLSVKTVAEVKPDKANNDTTPGNATDPSSLSSTANNIVAAKIDSDTVKPPTKDLDLNNPGVLKRAFIVFGGFALLAVAYFIFYKRKGKNNNSNSNHSGTNDTNQFKYGVLESDDRRDNMELSRVPLTMESDEDEEEDLEIFDLEQKKKSLSYVNLPLNDEDVVLSTSTDRNDRDNLLLDIESANSDTLINWSSNSNNKSIL